MQASSERSGERDGDAEGGAVRIGGFVVDADGRMAPAEEGGRPSLGFRWRGRPCRAALGREGLRIDSRAGLVPSTAGGAEGRARAFEELGRLSGLLPPGWRLVLLPDHAVRIEREVALEGPATAPGLLEEMVRFALSLDGYLDRLESAGVGAAGAGAAGSGVAKTWPG